MDPKRNPHTGKAGAAAAAYPAGPGGVPPTVSEAIDRLAADIRQLRVDFERFFSGALHLPPDELRRRVQLQLRQLRNVNAMSAVERFRLGDLEARHNSYDELYSRRLRDREESRQRSGHAPPPPSAAAPATRYDPGTGIVIGESPDPRAIAALYEGLGAAAATGAPAAAGTAEAPGGGGAGPRFDLASFGSYLQRQAAAIRDRTGCDEVQFRLATEDGTVKLKARPVARARPAAAGAPTAPERR
ncbi:MAG TPA: MXAN_5187 C-terminal domain-containing protein [Thermoanaerobaculia bacterium]|nr:MXAN_5187 C-terminal domain-containing protein [Thermoanaerobaculia bacterium]